MKPQRGGVMMERADRTKQLEPLRRFTSLPLERVRAALEEYDVRGALAAVGDRPLREHLLAVTPEGLAIVTPRKTRGSQDFEFSVRVARWAQVRLGGLGEPGTLADGDGRYDLVIRVGCSTFVAVLEGLSGQRALRDFVLAVQRAMRGGYAYIDYDAASTLTA